MNQASDFFGLRFQLPAKVNHVYETLWGQQVNPSLKQSDL
jgi:hypothetical protein